MTKEQFLQTLGSSHGNPDAKFTQRLTFVKNQYQDLVKICSPNQLVIVNQAFFYGIKYKEVPHPIEDDKQQRLVSFEPDTRTLKEVDVGSTIKSRKDFVTFFQDLINQLIGKECPGLEYMKFLAECQADIQQEVVKFIKNKDHMLNIESEDDDTTATKSKKRRDVKEEKKQHVKEAAASMTLDQLLAKPTSVSQSLSFAELKKQADTAMNRAMRTQQVHLNDK